MIANIENKSQEREDGFKIINFSENENRKVEKKCKNNNIIDNKEETSPKQKAEEYEEKDEENDKIDQLQGEECEDEKIKNSTRKKETSKTEAKNKLEKEYNPSEYMQKNINGKNFVFLPIEHKKPNIYGTLIEDSANIYKLNNKNGSDFNSDGENAINYNTSPINVNTNINQNFINSSFLNPFNNNLYYNWNRIFRDRSSYLNTRNLLHLYNMNYMMSIFTPYTMNMLMTNLMNLFNINNFDNCNFSNNDNLQRQNSSS